MSVKIAVEIANQTQDEIKRIKAKLKSLGSREKATVQVRTDGYGETKARLKSLNGTSEHEVKVKLKRDKVQDLRNEWRKKGVPIPTAERLYGMGFSPGDNFERFISQRHKSALPAFGSGGSDGPDKQMAAIHRLNKALKLSWKNVSKLIPSYRIWIGLVSALMPMVIALSVELFGLATAFGAVVGSGMALVGLGLLGQGRNMADSFENAKRKVKSFKKELFGVFQPTMRSFSPFANRFMEDAPERMTPIANAMRGLRKFEGAVDRAFGGLVGWTAESLRLMEQYAPILDQLTQRFGALIGTGVHNFLSWVTEELYENQEIMIDIGQTFIYIIATVYNLSKAFSNVLVFLKPFFGFIAGLTSLLKGPLAGALVVTIGLFLSFAKVYGLIMAMQGLTFWSKTVMWILSIADAAALALKPLWAMVTALGTVRALTLGVFAIAAGGLTYAYLDGKRPDGPDPRYGQAMGGSRGNTVVFNVNGDISDSTKRFITKKVTSTHGNESTIENRRNPTL